MQFDMTVCVAKVSYFWASFPDPALAPSVGGGRGRAVPAHRGHRAVRRQREFEEDRRDCCPTQLPGTQWACGRAAGRRHGPSNAQEVAVDGGTLGRKFNE
eukprot:1918430-Rhodomonas_salina.2